MKRYDLVATGGTFDIIHNGHRALLAKAFSISESVLIGLSSDDLAKQKGKKLINSYSQRFDSLRCEIDSVFPESEYQIRILESDFGPAVLEERVEALVVSHELQHKADMLNKMRHERGVPAADVVVVPMVLTSDGERLSTTRIRRGEITPQGKLL